MCWRVQAPGGLGPLFVQAPGGLGPPFMLRQVCDTSDRQPIVVTAMCCPLFRWCSANNLAPR